MIEQILAEFAEVTGRQFADRQNTIGASEIGQCARKIFFAKNAGDRIYGVDRRIMSTPGARRCAATCLKITFGFRLCSPVMATS